MLFLDETGTYQTDFSNDSEWESETNRYRMLQVARRLNRSYTIDVLEHGYWKTMTLGQQALNFRISALLRAMTGINICSSNHRPLYFDDRVSADLYQFVILLKS